MLPAAASANGAETLRQSLAIATLAPSRGASLETTSDLTNNDNNSSAASEVEVADDGGKNIP